MEREQIIKAFACCHSTDLSCIDCPFQDTDNFSECANLAKNTLLLIKELAEEVANLKAIAEQYQKQFEDCAEDRAKLTEENERLKNWCENKIVLDNDELKEVKTACLERIKLDVKRIKTDTVRKFAKRLKEYYNELSGKTFPPLVAYHIEQIEKEFLCDSET